MPYLPHANGGSEAVETYKEYGDSIDLVILDMIMPDIGEGEAYDRMNEVSSDAKVALSSGYSIDGQAQEIMERGDKALSDTFMTFPAFSPARLNRLL